MYTRSTIGIQKSTEGLYPVYELLDARLQAPHLKLYRDELVGAHDGILCVPPAFLQHPARRLLRLKIAQILQMDMFLLTIGCTTDSRCVCVCV